MSEFKTASPLGGEPPPAPAQAVPGEPAVVTVDPAQQSPEAKFNIFAPLGFCAGDSEYGRNPMREGCKCCYGLALLALIGSTALAAPWLITTFFGRVFGIVLYCFVLAPWSIGAIVVWVLMAVHAHQPNERLAGKKASIIGIKVFAITFCLHLATMCVGAVYAARDKDKKFADFTPSFHG
eukprot:SAG31_NODE_1113_length_9854_cov_2.770682_1_plen_180_part_00